MQLEKNWSSQFGRNGPLYKHRKARTSTRSFRFALFKYKYNIHLAFVNIGRYLARAIWPSVRTVDRVVRYLPRLQARQISYDSVNRAHRGPCHELNISRYSRTRGEYCTYTWKVRNESFLSTSVLCERLKLQCLYSTWSIFFQLHSSTRR